MGVGCVCAGAPREVIYTLQGYSSQLIPSGCTYEAEVNSLRTPHNPLQGYLAHEKEYGEAGHLIFSV